LSRTYLAHHELESDVVIRTEMLHREKGHPEALTTSESALTWYQALKVVSRRQWTLALRDRALVIAR
jgi:hypothetical protein